MSRLPRWLSSGLLLACLLPALAHATRDGEGEALTLYYRAAITIEPDGRLSSLSWQRAEKIPAVIRERLEARIRTWQFAPGTVGGHPARTDSYLLLRLLAAPQGDGYTLRVENAETGAAAPTMVPEYPREALRDGDEAGVLANLVVEPDGSRHVTIIGYQGEKRHRKAFEAAVQDMLATTEVHPERVDGHSAPAEFSVPITFCLTHGGDDGCEDPEWPERKTVSEGPAATAPGSPAPTGSVARLLTDVRDTAI